MQLISDFAPEHLLLTSYTLDLITFERMFLPHLKNTQILIVVDRTGYQKAVLAGPAVREVGSRYRVVQVDRPHYVFHPKIALMIKSGKLRLIVGSGNLTYSGVCQNLEVLDWVDFDYSEDIEFGDEVISFVHSLQDLLDRREGKRFLEAFVRPELKDREPRTMDRDVHFFHSLDQPLFQQVRKHLNDFKGAKIDILSPFIDQGNFVSALQSEFLPEEIRFVGPQAVWAVGAEACSVLQEVAAVYPEICDTDARKLHAKIINFRKGKNEVSILGSANATRAAWFGGYLSSKGNAEAVIVRKQKVSSDGILQLLKTKLMVFTPDVAIDEEKASKSLFRIIDAERIGDLAEMTIDSSHVSKIDRQIDVEFWNLDRHRAVATTEIKDEMVNVTAKIPIEILEQDWAGTLVRLEYWSGGLRSQSDWTWLSSEELISSSAEERPLRRAMSKIYQGVGSYSDIHQLAAYFSAQLIEIFSGFELENPISAKNYRDGSKEISKVSNGVSPASVELGFHLLTQGKSKNYNYLGMIAGALNILIHDDKSLREMSKKTARLIDLDSEGAEDKDLEELAALEEAQRKEFLLGIHGAAISALDVCKEKERGVRNRLQVLGLAIKFLVVLRSIGRNSTSQFFDLSDSTYVRDALSASSGDFVAEEMTKDPLLCQISIAWVLWGMAEHRLRPTEEIKAVATCCLQALSISEPFSRATYDGFTHVGGFPSFEKYLHDLGEVLNVKSRREVARAAIDLYLLAAAEGNASRATKPDIGDIEMLRDRLANGDLAQWLWKYDRMKVNAKTTIVVCVNPAKCDYCSGCNSKFPSQVRNLLLRNPQNPIQCSSCSRIVIGVGEA